MGIIDDNYSLGPPEVIFQANKDFAHALKDVGLELQPAKSKCYISEEHRDEQWNTLRGNIPNGTLKDKEGADILEGGRPMHDISVCNVPVGSEIYVKNYLSKKAHKIKAQFEDISKLHCLSSEKNHNIRHCKGIAVLPACTQQPSMR